MIIKFNSSLRTFYFADMSDLNREGDSHEEIATKIFENICAIVCEHYHEAPIPNPGEEIYQHLSKLARDLDKSLDTLERYSASDLRYQLRNLLEKHLQNNPAVPLPSGQETGKSLARIKGMLGILRP